MLRKFKITIDGKEYLVEMEEIGGNSGSVQHTNSAPVEETILPPLKEEKAEEKEEVIPVVSPEAVEGDPALAPMPGTILKIMVEVGQQVKENEPLLVLEAMKMENGIVATHDGTVTGIHVTPGQMVDVSAPLITVRK